MQKPLFLVSLTLHVSAIYHIIYTWLLLHKSSVHLKRHSDITKQMKMKLNFFWDIYIYRVVRSNAITGSEFESWWC